MRYSEIGSNDPVVKVILDPALKQRLVGATVLVALGVIFIPMLLERDNDDARLSVRMEIPPPPDLEMPDSFAKADDSQPIVPLPSMQEALKEIKPQEQSASAAEEEKPAEKSEPVKSVQSKPKTDKSKSEKAGVRQWVVQVGSFSHKTNAEALKDKLNNAGFKAYVESIKANTGFAYRVRIGPLKDRQEAESMVKRLNSKAGYRGIVIADGT